MKLIHGYETFKLHDVIGYRELNKEGSITEYTW